MPTSCRVTRLGPRGAGPGRAGLGPPLILLCRCRETTEQTSLDMTTRTRRSRLTVPGPVREASAVKKQTLLLQCHCNFAFQKYSSPIGQQRRQHENYALEKFSFCYILFQSVDSIISVFSVQGRILGGSRGCKCPPTPHPPAGSAPTSSASLALIGEDVKDCIWIWALQPPTV